ncbi:cytochrome b5 [Gautieria morchelliformis]|nr:cytochrome b5 [Gautieria morchelliformis]
MSDKKDGKEVTYDELKQHVNKENLYILLHNKVYNVSKFIDEHPGGDEVMLAEAGKDATEAFEDVGHSDEARALLDGLYVGDFEKGGVLKTKEIPNRTSGVVAQEQSSSAVTYLIPLALLGAYFAWRYYSS